MIKGWSEQNGNRYYFDLETGAMAKGTTTIDGTVYTFSWVTGALQ
jgi:glucan-binding YG repeat protein